MTLSKDNIDYVVYAAFSRTWLEIPGKFLWLFCDDSGLYEAGEISLKKDVIAVLLKGRKEKTSLSVLIMRFMVYLEIGSCF